MVVVVVVVAVARTCSVSGMSLVIQSKVSIRLRMTAFLRVMSFATEASSCTRALGFLESDGRLRPSSTSMLSTLRVVAELARARVTGAGDDSLLSAPLSITDDEADDGEGDGESELAGDGVEGSKKPSDVIDGLPMSRNRGESPRSRLRSVATRSSSLFS